MWTKVLDFLGILGGIGSLIIGVSAWLGKVWADRILQKEINKNKIKIAELSAELQKEIDKAKTQLDILKDCSIRYSEYQFKLYNELWGELYSLKIIADELWEKAEDSTLKNLSRQLKKTIEQVKKNALLIEEDHLEELLKLLDKFGNYQLGKKKLLDIRNNDFFPSNYEIQKMINYNLEFKNQYSEVLSKLEKKFRSQLKYYKES